MKNKTNKRSVFFISDRTGKTAESIGQSLLSQFDSIEFEYRLFSFVTSISQAQLVANEIQQDSIMSGEKPLVFSTLVNEELQDLILLTDACVISLFNSFIEPLEECLQIESSHTIGKPHEEFGNEEYRKHMDSIDFAMKNDDGINTSRFDQAEIILIGVSRCAKTPTCLYLAMNFSVKATNYPLTDDDFGDGVLPDFLQPFVNKIVGLTIQADQLSAIRQKRRPGTEYATLKKCKQEIKYAENIMKKAGIFMLDSTAMSIEEIAVKIAKEKHLLN